MEVPGTTINYTYIYLFSFAQNDNKCMLPFWTDLMQIFPRNWKHTLTKLLIGYLVNKKHSIKDGGDKSLYRYHYENTNSNCRIQIGWVFLRVDKNNSNLLGNFGFRMESMDLSTGLWYTDWLISECTFFSYQKNKNSECFFLGLRKKKLEVFF